MMTQHDIAHPHIVSRDEWLAERTKHLEHEKDLTKRHDRVTAERRLLPMTPIEKDYVFDGPGASSAWPTCSTDAASSSCTTSCSTRSGTRAARAAPGLWTPSAT